MQKASAAIDTSSEEYRLDCLARHICNLPTKTYRHAFLALMNKRHTPQFMEDITARVITQWGLLHPKS